MYLLKSSVLTLLLIASFLPNAFSQAILAKLQVEYQEKPLGLDIAQPHFSWQMKALDAQRGHAQKAYQIVVQDDKKKTVWDSKKVASDLSLNIAYQGEELQATTRYTWTLTVWDEKDRILRQTSWFETGLMNANPDLSAWNGATWIGGSAEDLVLYAPYLSVFKVNYTLQLDAASQSVKAGFVLGANDHRLLKKNLNLMGVQNAKNASYISFELDISAVDTAKTGLAKINIYRVGYSVNDKVETPFFVLDVPKNLINPSNKYALHTIRLECNFGIFEVFVDEVKISTTDEKNPSAFSAPGINLNPIGRGNNFISFPMLAEIGFQAPAGQKAFFSNVEVRNYRFPSNALFSEKLSGQPAYNGIFAPNISPYFLINNGAYQITGAEKAILVVADPSRNASPMLRTVFATSAKPIQRARLYVTARGIYEMYLNGQRISNDYFNPGLTQYNKTHLYQIYDLTSQLKPGVKNALGAWLSEGWWSGNITYSGESWNYFGDRQSLLCQLVITYTDGTQQTIASTPETWKYFNDGPIRYGSFFQGEVYDANKEMAIKGWATGGYDEKNWKPATSVPLEGTSYLGTFKNSRGQTETFNYKDYKLYGQMGDNARLVKTLTAQGATEVRPKVFVYDMGQNMVGFAKIKITKGIKGQQVTLRYAEVKYPDLPEYGENRGMIMMENIRAALAEDIYILKGGDETIQLRFTFHGYRYLEVTGIETMIPLANVQGQVISSIGELSSSYQTSNTLVNKLWSNITWSLRSNFLSIPTDTPARNERMGWSGDINVFSRSSTYLADADLFLRRHLLAMRDVQREDGRFTDVAPMGGGFGGTLWGSAGIVVAWETYQQFGDLQLLAEHYEAMKRYVNFLETKVEKNTGILNEGPLGDWLSPEGNKNDNTLFWMAYYAYDLEIVAKTAALLGKTADAANFQKRASEIKAAWNEIYVDKNIHKTIKSGVKTGFMGPPGEQQAKTESDKGKVIDTQASYAIPLALGVVNESNKPYLVAALDAAIQRKNTDDSGVERPAYSLMTGFIGTASMGEALSENGRSATVYRLLQQTTYPSWLYSVVNGATSIWERLNSYTVENGFGGNNSMNSFNHYSFGAIAAWMYNYSLGIQRADNPGFKQFKLNPTPDPDGKMTWAKGYYDSMYGRIESQWRLENGKTVYTIKVPANTSATLTLPVSLDRVTEGGLSLTKASGIKVLAEGKDQLTVQLVSGVYRFEVR
jgi:alpha-L-rhamnosidase